MNREFITYAIIGTPNGFENRIWGNDISGSGIILNAELDLENHKVNALPNTNLYLVKRKVINNQVYTFFILYRFAYETNATRAGGFYGSAVILQNVIPTNTALLVEALNELADRVKNECITNHRFHKDLTKFTSSAIPVSLQKLKENYNETIPYGYLYGVKHEEIYYSLAPNKVNIQGFISDLLRKEEYLQYGKVFFSDSVEIRDFVLERKSLKVIELGNEGKEKPSKPISPPMPIVPSTNGQKKSTPVSDDGIQKYLTEKVVVLENSVRNHQKIRYLFLAMVVSLASFFGYYVFESSQQIEKIRETLVSLEKQINDIPEPLQTIVPPPPLNVEERPKEKDKRDDTKKEGKSKKDDKKEKIEKGKNEETYIQHTVKQGENAYAIARKYCPNCSNELVNNMAKKIKQINSEVDTENLQVDTPLKVPTFH